MHGEQIEVTTATIQSILQHLDKNIIAVGTTSLRTIESLYWLGVKMLHKGNADTAIKPDINILDQWEPYELNDNGITAISALREVLNYLENNDEKIFHATTRMIIAPGYKPRIAKALITNFHQPQSTLLLLVAALIGDDWRRLYEFALENDFRFLSYGDGCLLYF
jgi:S-adenosylmethionine:tRNA ribosyltransferase-isomerase